MSGIKYGTLPEVNYLTILGKYVTPNTRVIGSKANTGTLTSNAVTDWKITPNARELSLNFTVQSASSASSLSIFFDVLDPIESSNSNVTASENPPVIRVPITTTAITSAPATLRLAITNGNIVVWINGNQTNLGMLSTPFKWQVEFVVSGSIGIIGTYEVRG